jgi:uncharacterized protein YigE (DUF2233 family)|eukprot:COSAG01_NODE_4419_length_5043_cov_37.692152_2_plen_79_part_00
MTRSRYDFTRLRDVAAGQSVVTTFTLSAASLLLATQSGDMVQEPGRYNLTFENGAGSVLRAAVQVTGTRVVVDAFPQT